MDINPNTSLELPCRVDDFKKLQQRSGEGGSNRLCIDYQSRHYRTAHIDHGLLQNVVLLHRCIRFCSKMTERISSEWRKSLIEQLLDNLQDVGDLGQLTAFRTG